jgi:hypothetical protein
MILSDDLRLRAIIGPTKIISSDPSLTSVFFASSSPRCPCPSGPFLKSRSRLSSTPAAAAASMCSMVS